MDPTTTRLVVVLALVIAVAVTGRLVESRRRRLVAIDDPSDDLSSNGAASGTGPRPASAVLFGTEACAPCRTVRARLREAEDRHEGFTWRYVDAAVDLDQARAHGVRRVPTLLVLDAAGRVVGRAGGVPRTDDLDAVIARAASAPVVAGDGPPARRPA